MLSREDPASSPQSARCEQFATQPAAFLVSDSRCSKPRLVLCTVTVSSQNQGGREASVQLGDLCDPHSVSLSLSLPLESCGTGTHLSGFPHELGESGREAAGPAPHVAASRARGYHS